jgi:hypothetical protein
MDFDVAGVKATPHGPVIGFVKRSHLERGIVGDHKQPLTAENLISDATPLPGVLAFLRDHPFAFVLIGSSVRGIVTRADLNKPPVRVYLFGLISLLEMHLGFWIRASFPDDSWQRALNPQRLNAAKDTFASRHRQHQEISLRDCLQFCDKRDLVLSRQDIRDTLDLGSKPAARA